MGFKSVWKVLGVLEVSEVLDNVGAVEGVEGVEGVGEVEAPGMHQCVLTTWGPFPI